MRPHIAWAQKLPMAGLVLCVLGSTSIAAGLLVLAASLEIGVGAFLGYLIVSSTFPMADSWDPQNRVYGNGVCNW